MKNKFAILLVGTLLLAAGAHRLAIETRGEVIIYDTLDHQIGGVPQQSGSDAVSFTSQYGYVDLSRLPVVTINGVAPATTQSNNFMSVSNPTSMAESDIFTSIEKLATLQARGILTQQEFMAKKAELLSRL